MHNSKLDSYANVFSSEIYKLNPYTDIKQNYENQMQIVDVTPFNLNYPCWRILDDSGFSVERDSSFCVRGIPPQVEVSKHGA